eukprot:gnl/TRDRNA2_/TRDRNA2_168819_c0_seq4.p1 gnl/TRDRNA2_/TRDRNA2_168819_c0~~gnl/TRDRNA2_/TRDRNA2_168819_c0_seq4.p1  ORF type:complete len:115 (+),score=19.88 gnl/TRDRNA2_/TRDRNA2_168819_c0_seq4:105-449(+)
MGRRLTQLFMLIFMGLAQGYDLDKCADTDDCADMETDETALLQSDMFLKSRAERTYSEEATRAAAISEANRVSDAKLAALYSSFQQALHQPASNPQSTGHPRLWRGALHMYLDC